MRQLQCLLYQNDCYVANKYIEPTHIVLHTTGANNPTLKRYVQPHIGQTSGMKEYVPTQKTYTREQMVELLGNNKYLNDWNRPMVEGKCVHAFIGKLADGSIATVQTLPWKMRPWGVGSGSNGSYNNCAIQFEICEDDTRSAEYCKATFKEAAELCAMLCKEYKIPVAHIVSHAEAGRRGYGSKHSDPNPWWLRHGLDMDDFRDEVGRLLNTSVPADTTVVPEVDEFKVGDVVQLVPGATYASGKSIPSWVFKCRLYVRSIRDNGDVVISTLKEGDVTGVINPKSIYKYDDGFVAYKIKVAVDALNVRSGPGTDNDIVGCIRDYGVYTIVETKGDWGLLSSGAGWIHLGYTRKI